MTPADSAKRLRALLARPGAVRGLAVHDVFCGLAAQQAGLEMVFAGGFGAAASRLGLPDAGLLTLTEMAGTVRSLAGRLDIPVIADADTGHGGLVNVARTVRELERAGAAGILLEDQVSPKRCGHFQGKDVVAAEEMLARLRAAIAARQNPDFVIIARTDARQVTGLDDAIFRANLYGEAGADGVFIEAPQSGEELREIPRHVPYPLMANMLTGGLTPLLTAADLEAMGYKIIAFPIETLLVTLHAVRRLAEHVRNDGTVRALEAEMASFDEVKDLLGLQQILEAARRAQDGGPVKG